MKSNRLAVWIGSVALVNTLAAPSEAAAPQHHQYGLTILRTLGGVGTFAAEAHGLNNSGAAAGQAALPSGDEHASFWRNGSISDLGTLGGPDSLVNVANHTLNEKNMVVGISETSTPDPNGDDLCNLGTFLVCLPFVWEDGVLTALPTLGGNNGQALGINNRGQIAGQAETPNSDPCSPFAREVEAVIWEHGVVKEILPPFGGTAAVANAINDNGQAVGISGCITANLYAVLWNHGTPINLGSLGGVAGNFAFDINNKGQVVGQSDLPGDMLLHAFLWQDGVMTDLGSLSEALPASEAIGINNRGQVVGFSLNAAGDDPSAVAVLWEDGTITDLNTVVPADSPLFLMEATAINDRGEIAGFGRLADGEHRGFILTPCEPRSADDCVIRREDLTAALARSARVKQRLDLRQSWLQRRVHH